MQEKLTSLSSQGLSAVQASLEALQLSEKQLKKIAQQNRDRLRNAIIEILKREFVHQSSLTLSQLASLLNNWWQIQHGVGLAQVVNEPDFIALINEMVGSGEIMQIKQRFSMPYSFGSVLHSLSHNGSTTSSLRSIVFESASHGTDLLNRQPESPLESTPAMLVSK